MKKILALIVALLFGASILAPLPAYAGETPGGDTSCNTSSDPTCNDPDPCAEEIDYLHQVIWSYQDALAASQNDTAHWREAHDRVAAYAVERQEEYAHLQTEYRKLYDKFVWKSDRVQILKMKIAMLKAKQ
jgi:hypothetical protein